MEDLLVTDGAGRTADDSEAGLEGGRRRLLPFRMPNNRRGQAADVSRSSPHVLGRGVASGRSTVVRIRKATPRDSSESTSIGRRLWTAFTDGPGATGSTRTLDPCGSRECRRG